MSETQASGAPSGPAEGREREAMKIGVEELALGIIQGLGYGILAVGLSLIYKSNRFVNFAHGNLGALVAVVFLKLVVDVDMPYGLALVVALLLGGALGGLVELAIVRRLFEAPRLVLVVATIAVAQIFFYFALQRWLGADQQRLVEDGYPLMLNVSWRIGALTLDGAEVAILIVVPLLALALAAFFRYSPYGQAIRASSENADAARLAGISVRRMSTLVWVIAGLLAGVTMILLAPTRSVFQVGALGPSVLVRALGASLIGRMTNLPVAFGSGIAIGVLETIAFANFTEGGIQDLVVFVIVMVALGVRARGLSRASRRSDAGFSFGAETRELPPDVAAMPRVRRMRSAGVAAAMAVAVAAPYLPVLGLNTSERTFLMTLLWGYAIVALSLTVLTGWAGQVSLGQFAFVGVGSFAAARFAGDLPLPLLLLACGALGAGVAVLVGLPAVRIQGLFLAVATLAFAVVAMGWAFQQDWLVGSASGVSIARPDVIRTDKALYYFALALLVLFALGCRNLRRSGPGRVMLAVRDNDMAARSEGLSASGTRLLGFALAGFMAAVAGVIFAYARGNFTATDFSPLVSLEMVLVVIIGGLGSIPGAIAGAVLVHGIPMFMGDTTSTGDLPRFLTGAIAVLLVLLFLPGGLISLIHRGRDALVGRIVREEHDLPRPPRLVPPLRALARVALGRST